MSLRDLLYTPAVYLAGQRLLGFARMRRWCLDEIVRAQPGERVLDVGCGPAFVLDWLPAVDYTGFDTDARSIEVARRRYPHAGTFFAEPLDDKRADQIGPFDLVLLFGVLHHLSDSDAAALLTRCQRRLAPHGRIVTLDGCYRDGQSWIDRRLLDRDQGEFVRDRDGYRRLMEPKFPVLKEHIRSDLARVPYTIIMFEGRASHVPPTAPAEE